MSKVACLLVGFVLTVAAGAIAQQSNVGGQATRARFTSLGVGAAPPAGSGSITASGTVTASNYVGNVGGVAPSDFARLSQANVFAGGQAFGGPAVGLRGTANNQTTNESYVSFQQLSGSENGWVGYGTGTNDIRLQNNIPGAALALQTVGGTVLANDSPVLTLASGGNITVAPTIGGNTILTTGSGLNASNLSTGTVPDARLSGTYSGTLTFPAVVTIAATTGQFTNATVGGNAVATETSGNFTVTWDYACTTSPTTTYGYVKVGSLVTLTVKASSGFPCTADAFEFGTSGTPLPAAIRPTLSAVMTAGASWQVLDDASYDGAVTLQVLSTGDVELFLRRDGVSGWNASGTNRGGPNVGDTFHYYLGNP